MNSTSSTLAMSLGLFGDAPQPEMSEADVVRSSSAMAEDYNQGMTFMGEESDADDFHTTGAMSLVRTVFAIAVVWTTAIATVLALGA